MTVETIFFFCINQYQFLGDADLLVVHYDASDHLHCYNPDTGQWRVLADLPQGAGHEYAAITGQSRELYHLELLQGSFPGQQSKVYLVGGRSRDGRSLRSVFCYDLATATWSRLPDMKEVTISCVFRIS